MFKRERSDAYCFNWNEIESVQTRKVVAETGVAVETLSEPVLMGIMVDSTQKPDALFFVRRVARPFVAPVEMEEKGMSNN